MQLYSTEEIEGIKKMVRWVFAPSRLIHVVVIVLFFFIWISILIFAEQALPFLLVVPLGLLVPLVLLVSILRYRSRWAYFTVLSFCFAVILLNLSRLPYYVNLYLGNDEGELALCSCSPIHDIQNILIGILLALVAIALMHHRKMADLYEWSMRGFLKSAIGGCFFYLFLSVMTYFF